MVSPADRNPNTTPTSANELIDTLCAGYGFVSREQLIDLLEEGIFQIWRANNIYALVEFVDTSYGKTLNVLTVTGSKDDWHVGIEALERIAQINDVKLIYSVGHLGWEKAMREHGYKTERVLRMSKVLT